MKTLKKKNKGFNSVEELYINCPCYYTVCSCSGQNVSEDTKKRINGYLTREPYVTTSPTRA